MKSPIFLAHSAAYAVARLVPGVLTFAALALYTRWLTPHQFGRYSLVIAAVALGRVAFFYWLRLCVLRLLPQDADFRPRFLTSLALGYAGSAVAAALAAAALLGFGEDPHLVLLGLLLLWAYGWFDINLDILRADLEPRLYGILLTWRTAVSFALGALLVAYHPVAESALIGTAAGTLLPGPGSRVLARHWRTARIAIASRATLRDMLQFGLPPTAAVAFALVVSTSDRLFLAWLDGNAAAGLYAASYDFAQNAISGLLLPVSLASFPLAVRALEAGGEQAAAIELERNLTVLALIGVPLAVGLAIVSQNASHLLLGADFRGTARQIIPWVVFAGLLASLIELHFNRAFQLSKRTGRQVIPYAAAAALNVILNLIWIPKLGVMGAVYATLLSYIVAVGLAWQVGRKVFPLNLPSRHLARITLSTVVMGAVVWPLRHYVGIGALVAQVGCGAIAFYAAISVSFGSWRPRTVVHRLLEVES